MAKKFPPEKDYPDFSKHTSFLAKVLSKEMYARLRDVKTSSGCTLDKCIQTGQPEDRFIPTNTCAQGRKKYWRTVPPNATRNGSFSEPWVYVMLVHVMTMQHEIYRNGQMEQLALGVHAGLDRDHMLWCTAQLQLLLMSLTCHQTSNWTTFVEWAMSSKHVYGLYTHSHLPHATLRCNPQLVVGLMWEFSLPAVHVSC